MSEALARALFPLLALAAAGSPLLRGDREAAEALAPAPWPTAFEGRRISPIPPTPEDRILERQFPGRVARFSDGRRQIVLRQVARPTRRLHPARDCFRSTGWEIAPAPMRMAPGNAPAACFLARRGGRTLHICERISGRDGASWPDISSWYWAATFDGGTGPWLATLTVETVAGVD
jgi:hypothetical protein